MSAESVPRRLLKAFRVEAALFLFVVVLVGPIVAPVSAQPASRYALTAALAERHTVDISGYPLGVDRAIYRGHLRSDKAPGQPVIAIPFYVIARAFGAENATHLRVNGNLGLWFVTFWTAVVPLALLIVLMYRACKRTAPQHALAAALAIGLGGMLLPYAAHLFGHVLGALCAFAGWYVLSPDPRGTRRLVAAGALLGAAVFVEYHAAVAAIAIALYAAWHARGRVPWLVAGAMPFVVALGWYEWRAFGAPWRLPFTYFAGTIEGTTRGGYRLAGAHGFWDVLGSAHGFLPNAPIALCGAGAAVYLACRGKGVLRRDALLALAIFVPLLVLIAGWSGTPTLETPGPRYLAPAIPFLAVPLAAVWGRAPRAFAAIATFSAAVGLMAASGKINIASRLTPAAEYLKDVSHHRFSPTILSMATGRTGVVLYIAAASGATLLLRNVARAPATRRDNRAAPSQVSGTAA